VAEKGKISGDFAGDGGDDPGDTDVYEVECSTAGRLCAVMEDTGPFFDNIFGVFVECLDPEYSFDVDIANPGGTTGGVCVNNCSFAVVGAFCDENSPFCDDNYLLKIKCQKEINDIFFIFDD
jgi:hypothetical protein